VRLDNVFKTFGFAFANLASRPFAVRYLRVVSTLFLP
jgi:hypothetical protein